MLHNSNLRMSFSDKLSLMKIYKIFIFQIENSSVTRKLSIYEKIEKFRALYLIRIYLILKGFL